MGNRGNYRRIRVPTNLRTLSPQRQIKPMKKLIPILLLPIFLIACGGTGGFQLSDAQITIAVQTGTSAAFQFAIKDSAKRADIAKYVSAIAGVARSATGKETPDQLSQSLMSAIPASIQAELPQIG